MTLPDDRKSSHHRDLGNEAPGPLDGVRVIDLTAMASGPFATSILGDQGADVIKVEPPGKGDLLRHIGTTRGGISAVFANLNRNKRSLALDLSEPRGLEVLAHLVAAADVFVQNFRPGVADRMGIGAARLRENHSELIAVSISGYGEAGPYAQRPVYDSVMQAYAGFAASQSDPTTGVPEFVRNIVCDKGTALTVAQAITSALFARERGRGGQHLRISMLHASIAFLWPDTMQNHTYLGEGGSAPMGRQSLPAVRRTADGYMTISVIQDREFRALCDTIGRRELADDPRFADAGARARNAGPLHEILNPITATQPTAEWARRLAEAGVPHAVVNDLESLPSDPQVVENQLLVETEHPAAGAMRTPRPVGDYETTPTSIRRPAPMLGEHNEEILREHGFTEDEIANLKSDSILG